MESNELSNFESIDLLEAFIVRYNAEQDAALEQQEAKELASSIMAADKREIQALKDELAAKDTALKQHAQTIAKHVELQKAADKLVDKYKALEIENLNLTTMLNGLKGELTALKSGGSPKKLKDQVKRIKEKSEEKTKRITKLEAEARQYRHDVKKLKADIEEANVMIESNHVNGGQYGVYHKGDDHLIHWENPITALDDEGNKTKSIALLHMRKCGTGRMIILDDNNDIVIAKPSRYRATEELKNFAMSWLYRVNRTQNGTVKPADLVPVNYNK